MQDDTNVDENDDVVDVEDPTVATDASVDAEAGAGSDEETDEVEA